MAYPPDVPRPDAPNAQRACDADNSGQAAKQQAVGSGPNPNYRRPTPLEEMDKQLGHHDESFTRIAKGAAFLRENPAFNEFIQLIRTGSLSI